MAKIGQWNTLMAVEITDIGLMLDGGEHGKILAPAKYLPEDAEPGEEFEVFVYLDSEDRLIATTEEPIAQVGEFALSKAARVVYSPGFMRGYSLGGAPRKLGEHHGWRNS